MTNETVTLAFEDDVAIIIIDNPPVNATSNAVRIGLQKAVEAVNEARPRAAVIRCAGRTFVAGGDITEFDKPPLEPHLPDVCDAIEACPVPFIALMHGTVLGGGLEIALACDFRLALEGTNLGLPEVNIGLIPGAGGTQRLPRLVGVENAAKIACSGIMFPAQVMRDMGAVDAVIADLDKGLESALANLPERPMPVSGREAVSPGADWFAEKRKELAKVAKGQESPLHALDAIEWATNTDFAEGMKRERTLFSELKNSRQSRALRHAFFAERKAAKPDALAGATPAEISMVAIIGGGLMGSGIATTCLNAGYSVVMIEQSEDAAEAGVGRVRANLEGAVKRGKLTATAMQSMLSRMKVGSDYKLAAGADLAIEAVFEDASVKNAVFRELDKVMGKDAVFATNTSYLDPALIFEGISNPRRCLGLHFFSPAHVMKLVEVVRTGETGTDALATGFSLARKMNKIAVLCGVCDGFIGNRMLAAYRRACDYMLADGASPQEIDAAMRAFGMPMGPYELQDLTGLQIAWANRKRQAATRPPEQRYVNLADTLCEMDRLGQRSGKGWYRYEEGNRKPIQDPVVDELLETYRRENSIEPKSFSQDEIQKRALAALINEGALIIEEGIAASRSDVDVVKLHGYGFPRWRGGPMYYGEQEGFETFGWMLDTMMAESPNSWRRSALLGG